MHSLLGLIVLFGLCVLLNATVTWRRRTTAGKAGDGSRSHTRHNTTHGKAKVHAPKDENKCTLKSFNDARAYPLLVMSLDGFGRDYDEYGIVKAFDRFRKEGTAAEYMISAYPSRTFQSHASISTGQFVDNHGLVSNLIYDPVKNPEMKFDKDDKNNFFEGKPIWLAAKESGRRVHCLEWYGCSFTRIKDRLDFVQDIIKGGHTFKEKLDLVSKALEADSAKRPELIMFYHMYPDEAAHWKSDDEVREALKSINTDLEAFLADLHHKGILNCLNFIILSDHGMVKLNSMVRLNNVVEKPAPNVELIPSEMRFQNGIICRIHIAKALENREWVAVWEEEYRQYLKKHPKTTMEEYAIKFVVNRLKCPKPNPATGKPDYYVYDRAALPKRFHYGANARSGDIIAEAQIGLDIRAQEGGKSMLKHNHGYDYLNHEMDSIFFARGPDIRTGHKIRPFLNIELFNLFQSLMKLEKPFENDGTPGALYSVLRDEASVKRPAQSEVVNLKMESFKPSLRVRDLTRRSLSRRHKQVSAFFLGSQPTGESGKRGRLISITRNNPYKLAACDFDAFALYHTTEQDIRGKSFFAVEHLVRSQFIHAAAASKQPPASNATVFGSESQNAARWAAAERATQPLADDHLWHTVLAQPNNPLPDLTLTRAFFPKQFLQEKMPCLQKFTHEFALKHTDFIAISGTVYDYNLDGVADVKQEYRESHYEPSHSGYLPTHFFRVMLYCKDGNWHHNKVACQRPNATRVISFMLPLSEDFNCLACEDYLLKNTARLRDVELLTGTEFFHDQITFNEWQKSAEWRTHVPMALWS